MAGYRRMKTVVVSNSSEESVIVGQEGVKVPSKDSWLTIGEVEKLTGTSKETLRFYDAKGLLCPVRTGQNVSNNRKLYSGDDLFRLQSILALRAYSFGLDEIKRILDDKEIDICDVMAEKLCELKWQEARLRALVLFAKFIDVTDDDFIEGLANGPVSIDMLADLARANVSHEKALQRLDAYSEDEAAVALRDLRNIVAGLLLLDEVKGFRGICELVTEFFAWWNGFACSINEVGYLGFWAIFEDHILIPSYIESSFAPGDAGFIEMLTFFVLMTHIARENEGLVCDIAELVDVDVVSAIDKMNKFVNTITCLLLGNNGAVTISNNERIKVVSHVVVFLVRIMKDRELSEYLGLADNAETMSTALLKNLQLIEVIGGEV